MRKHSLALMLLILLLPWPQASARAGDVAAEITCSGHGCVYLSLIAYHPQIVLLAPAAGTAIGSLAPVLAWRPPVTGNYRIQLSEDAAFTPTSSFALSETKDVKSPLPAQVDTLITSDLKPHQTYYWRIEKTGKDSTLSASEYFITPAKNAGSLPSGVQMLAPANNSSVASPSVVLAWQPVPGALYYRIRVYDSNNVLIGDAPADISGTTASAEVPNLVPGTTYHWKVKALNAYGWGPYLADHYFKVS